MSIKGTKRIVIVVTLIVVISYLWIGQIIDTQGIVMKNKLMIDGPLIAHVNEEFKISGNNKILAGEKIDLYLNGGGPIAFSVVEVKPPFLFKFKISITEESISVNDNIIYEGSTPEKTFYFHIRAHRSTSNVLSVKVER